MMLNRMNTGNRAPIYPKFPASILTSTPTGALDGHSKITKQLGSCTFIVIKGMDADFRTIGGAGIF